MKKILITGTLGFIFSNFIRLVSQDHFNISGGLSFIGLDKAVKQYNLDNMYKMCPFYLADICDAHMLDRIFSLEKPDIVIGGAAESFVDNSITDVLPFLNSNIIGTQNLINQCLKHNVEKYVHIGTDEIYGQKLIRDDAPWTESDIMSPRNPYACSKAAAEMVVLAAHHTHNLQYQITRSCNVFGPRQKKENLVPHIITSIKNSSTVRIHGNGLNFRQYIYVEDVVSAIMTVVKRGNINEIYNIGDNNYFTNLEMVDNIGKIMKCRPDITFIPDRKAHDFGYSVNSDKLRKLGWKPKFSFQDALQKTVLSYV